MDAPLPVSSFAFVVSVRITTTIVTTAMPTTQPMRKAGPFTRAFTENNIRMHAMIGIGLIAMPTASGSRSPRALSNMQSPYPGSVGRRSRA